VSSIPQPAGREIDGLDLIAEHRAKRLRLSMPDDLATLLLPAVFLVATAWAIVGIGGFPNPLTFALFAVVYAVLSRAEFEIGATAAIPTQLVFVPMLFAMPLGWAPAAVAAGSLIRVAWDRLQQRRRGPAVTIALLNSGYSLGPVFVLALYSHDHAPRWSMWPAYVAALTAQFVVDGAVHATWHRAIRRGAWPKVRGFTHAYAVDAALAPIGLIVAFQTDTRPYLLVLVLPLVALISLFSREREHRIDAALELGHAYRGTALLLGDVVEADDAYTGEHSRDVVTLTLEVADRLGLDSRERRTAEFTALLHDVGKIRMPAHIINKPGPLDPDERRIIQTHTLEAEAMLTRIGGLLGEVGGIIRSCHERWDGIGYPDGLAGEHIPLIARIVCAADAYSAMTTNRPYRAAMSHEQAVVELQRCSGSQFDPRVVEVLLEVVAETQKAPPKRSLLEVAAA
jgi:HD-GYP domain-containing protein (c-di-GMP phosphodiesterase class II)